MKGASALTITKYMNRKEASAYLRQKWGIRLAAPTLAKKATQGGGPPFQLDGRFPVYSDAGLDAYAQARLGATVSSTAEYRAAAGRQLPASLSATEFPAREDHSLPDKRCDAGWREPTP